jgi:LysR family glycine cleavage system transcriptional activator
MVSRRRSIPSLASLQAFDSAARLLSFTRAADELALTQSAVSRQVQTLEEGVGLALFQRVGNRLVLTVAGENYHREIAPLLEALRSATLRLMAFKGTGGTLRLVVLPTLGMKWLVPRLPRFIAAHPEVQVSLDTRTTPVDLRETGFDAAIQHGEPTWPGAVAVRLMGEELVVVASPPLLPRGKPARRAALLTLPLLQQGTRPDAWADWFLAAGVPRADAYGGLRFEQFSHVIQAATAGLGLALVPRFLVADEIRAGQLGEASAHVLAGPRPYCLVYAERKAHDPAVRAFREWLKAEATAFEAGSAADRAVR